MITAQQIKAARALLDWKQSDLAVAAAISLPSINNIERHIGSPRTDTMNAIQMAFEKRGIEFLSGGVRLSEEIFEMTKHEGADFITWLNDDLFSCMQGPNDEALMCGLDERKFPEYAPDEVMRYEAHQQSTGFKEKILIKSGDNFFLAKPQVYKWVAPELMGTIPYLVYKDRLAMILWDARRTVIIRNQAIADTFRRQFEFLWKLAEAVPMGSKRKIEDPNFVDSLGKKPAKIPPRKK